MDEVKHNLFVLNLCQIKKFGTIANRCHMLIDIVAVFVLLGCDESDGRIQHFDYTHHAMHDVVDFVFLLVQQQSLLRYVSPLHVS